MAGLYFARICGDKPPLTYLGWPGVVVGLEAALSELAILPERRVAEAAGSIRAVP
jgi:hypothetical protein